jgi:hypothetical protein
LKKLGVDVDGGRIFYSESVRDFAFSEYLVLPPGPLVVLIAADASTVSADVVSRVADYLLDAGLVFVGLWGPDCERVHDIFDDQYVGDGTVERDLPLTTTWHDDESLVDAVEFFARNGMSLGGCETGPVSHLAIAVASTEWASAVESTLSGFVRGDHDDRPL